MADYGCQNPELSQTLARSPRLDATSDIRDILHMAPFLYGKPISSKADITDGVRLSPVVRSRGLVLVCYMHYLPQLCGRDRVFDLAASCVASILRALYCATVQKTGSALEYHARETSYKTAASYSEALKELQLALDDPQRSFSAEVLCATILLCAYEVRHPAYLVDIYVLPLYCGINQLF